VSLGQIAAVDRYSMNSLLELIHLMKKIKFQIAVRQLLLVEVAY
jgi:hypothetical protein